MYIYYHLSSIKDHQHTIFITKLLKACDINDLVINNMYYCKFQKNDLVVAGRFNEQHNLQSSQRKVATLFDKMQSSLLIEKIYRRAFT